MRVRRRLVLAGLLGVGVVLLFGLWAGWQAWSVNRDLSAAVDDAARLQQAVLDHDDAAQQVALDDLQEHSAAAADRTDGPTWSVLERVPFVGDDARGVAVASGVVSDLATDGVEPLLRVTDDIDTLLPRDAAVSVSAVRELQRPVAHGEAAFAAAERELAAQDPSSYAGRLRDKYRELTEKVHDAHHVLAAASTALDVMPTMLGEDGPRHYLLIFQNNAEIRSTGGLPGAVSLVTAADGKVEMTRQVGADAFGERPTPVLPLSPAERRIYGEQLGTYFVDANFTPDFPRTAELMKARWEEVFGGRIDGVISVDPVAMSYLLQATGPVTVGDTELTADNAVDTLLHQVYVDHPVPAAQDAYFRDVARAVFDQVSGGAENPIDLAEALGRAADEHRIYVHSFHADEQGEITTSQIAGHLTDDSATGPQVGVFLNDATASKMSYYLRYDAALDATYCTAGVQGLAGTMHLSSTAPKDAADLPTYVTGTGEYGTEQGHELLLIRLYGPVGGAISDVAINSRPVHGFNVVDQDGRPVGTVVVELGPGEKVDVTWRMKSGPDQTGRSTLSVTPGVEAGRDSSSSAVSACA